ncbi:peptide ABC transporter [Prochlorococcus marinus str. MU1404]|uniref:ABC transporter permease n=1 Tax=Prochlorococcus marinus TaxID=1219 RepID=UPI001ADB81FB|nr:ABC transporter permease [Prochlorococcus marinus]MBO8229621.1 ABC transporter permease [Prochlorococcus marinus XMU1404]MBW3072698.1 peptide ABC transporter [Prochlorococcus marinus str. MU1404]MCR8546044.1 ABC transporter permease [Prochlorococcus marinus CUG1432]
MKFLEANNFFGYSFSMLSNDIFAPPSLSHFCGTDRLGRDVCLRTLQGSSLAIEVVFLAILFSLSLGLPLGLLSGYFGGFFDKCLSLIMDTIFSIPVILLSVVVAFVLGKGIFNASLALCIVYSPQYFRLIRNQTILVKSETYVEAAQVSGADVKTIIFKYILPNVITPLPILLTLNAADAVLVLGSLGFLGLGVPADVPEWGSDLNLALAALPTGIWWTALFPGLAMFFLVLGLSFIGEDLEEIFDNQNSK